jgi:hypothetical protein
MTLTLQNSLLPLPSAPRLGMALLALAVLLPVFVNAWPSVIGSALLVMLSLRVRGRFEYSRLIPRTFDDWMSYFLIGALSIWCVSLYFYAGIQ